MGYVVFERKRQRVYGMAVSLQRLGRIVLNKPAAANLRDQGATNALILWDEENRRVAIRPIFIKDPRAYPVKYGNARTTAGATISAKTFFDSIGLDYEETRQYEATWNVQEGLLEIEVPAERIKKMRQPSVARLPFRGKTA
jgi:hypothetical protein